eukprot:348413-Pyramimonas_sp.AAC.1
MGRGLARGALGPRGRCARPGPGGRRRIWSLGGMLRMVLRRCQARSLLDSIRVRLGAPAAARGGQAGESCVHPRSRSPEARVGWRQGRHRLPNARSAVPQDLFHLGGGVVPAVVRSSHSS